MKPNTKPVLCYYGTGIEIKLGDRILYPKWFSKKPGTVVYVPGESKVNKSMEYEDVKLWAIQLDEEPNDIITMGYFPPDEVVPKKLVFVKRGKAVGAIGENEGIGGWY